jgi:hypothetical protein
MYRPDVGPDYFTQAVLDQAFADLSETYAEVLRIRKVPYITRSMTGTGTAPKACRSYRTGLRVEIRRALALARSTSHRCSSGCSRAR